MKKEYDLRKMKVKRRGPLPKETKVQKTIRIDLDVLNWFIQQAEKRGIPYQTLMNASLKEVMHQAEALEQMAQRDSSQPLEDDKIRRIVREEIQLLKRA